MRENILINISLLDSAETQYSLMMNRQICIQSSDILHGQSSPTVSIFLNVCDQISKAEVEHIVKIWYWFIQVLKGKYQKTICPSDISAQESVKQLMSPAQWSHDHLCVKTRVAVIKIRNVHYINYIGFRMVSSPRSDSTAIVSNM